MILLLLAQLFLGTPHPTLVHWKGIAIQDVNDDGTTFIRPPLGYSVYRASIAIDGSVGAFVLLNADAFVQGTISDGVNPDDCEYLDEATVGLATYTYKVGAMDFNGEAISGQSNAVEIPLNPNAPTSVTVTIE